MGEGGGLMSHVEFNTTVDIILNLLFVVISISILEKV